MGYQAIFCVRDGNGKSLGRFAGWTSEEAIKRAQAKYPKATGLTAKSTGEENR
jgi:hypothetical protein